MTKVKKILITGSSGFIGRYVVNSLLDSPNYDLVIWDRFTMGNFLDRSKRCQVLENIKPDVVIHLAWNPTKNVNYDRDSQNLVWAQSTIEFIEECTRRNIWIIYSGSASELNSSIINDLPYGIAKSEVSQYLKRLDKYDQYSLLLIQYVFSLKDRRPRLLSDFSEANTNKKFKLSNPNNKHDFIEVRDVACGITSVLNNHITGTIYLGTGKERTVGTFILSAAKALNTSINELDFANSDLTNCLESPVQPNKLFACKWYPLETEKFFIN